MKIFLNTNQVSQKKYVEFVVAVSEDLRDSDGKTFQSTNSLLPPRINIFKLTTFSLSILLCKYTHERTNILNIHNLERGKDSLRFPIFIASLS